MRDCREKRAGLRDQDLTSRPHFLASALEPVFLDHVFSSADITVVPREIEDNRYAKILGGK